MNRGRKAAPGAPWLRIVGALLGAVILYLTGRWVSHDLVKHLGTLMLPHNEPMLHHMIMTTAVVYIILMMVPFMPAAEIGFSMLVIFGGKIAFLVYISTVAALTLAYGVGRLFPVTVTAKILGGIGLTRAQEQLNRFAPLSQRERLASFERATTSGLMARIVRHRIVALAVLLNIPGNVLFGGGGGIALVAGMTRMFGAAVYLLTVVIAVAPIPLVVYLTD